MNVSGRSVANALRAHLAHPVPTSLVVIQDSLNHKPFSISHGFGGSAQGHNGVKDVISALGGQTDFHRLRIGIGRPPGPDGVSDFVLGRLGSSERQFLDPGGPGTDKLWQMIEKIVKQGGRA
jgi:PTH1 family peptidyl-tRNA hydrolase